MPTGFTGALTLQQYANESNNPLIQSVVFSLLDVHSVLNDIPFETVPTLKVNGTRVVGNLPSPNWRKLNAGAVAVSGTATPFQEQAYVVSNVIDIDRLMLMDKNAVGNPLSVQTDMYLRALTYDITDKFFNNNHTSGNADAFVGIRQRLDDTTTWGTNTQCKIDAGGVDLSDGGMSATNANKFVKYIDNILDVMGDPDGNGIVLYMNRDLRRRFAWAIRILGVGAGFEMTKDAFDRRVTLYRNATVRSIGLKADQSTEILTSTETNVGANGSSNFTSVYAVKYGAGWFNGWQMEPFRVLPIGLRPDEPNMYRLFLEWAEGLYQEHTRAIARLYDIKVS